MSEQQDKLNRAMAMIGSGRITRREFVQLAIASGIKDWETREKFVNAASYISSIFAWAASQDDTASELMDALMDAASFGWEKAYGLEEDTEDVKPLSKRERRRLNKQKRKQ